MQYDLFQRSSESADKTSRDGGSVQAPPFNPFSADERVREGELQEGETVGLILGEGGRRPTGKRVVVGEVTGYAVRHPDYFDLQLTNITTWIYQNPPRDIQQLGDNFLGNFRINIREGVRPTFKILRGGGEEARSLIPAQEIPFHRCWSCRRPIALERDGVFCPNCGVRLSVGEQRETPLAPPKGQEACPACWHPNEEHASHCRYCGFERSLNGRAEAAVGETVYLKLTEEGKRCGNLRGQLQDLRVEKIFRHGGAELVGKINKIKFEDQAPAQLGPALSPTFTAQLTFEVDEKFFEESINRLETGDRLRASELKIRCPNCLEWRRREEFPFVLGRFCTRCGQRVRILPHSEWPQRRHPSNKEIIQAHHCGSFFRQGVDRFCGGCGEDVQNFRPGSGRFSRLG